MRPRSRTPPVAFLAGRVGALTDTSVVAIAQPSHAWCARNRAFRIAAIFGQQFTTTYREADEASARSFRTRSSITRLLSEEEARLSLPGMRHHANGWHSRRLGQQVVYVADGIGVQICPRPVVPHPPEWVAIGTSQGAAKSACRRQQGAHARYLSRYRARRVDRPRLRRARTICHVPESVTSDGAARVTPGLRGMCRAVPGCRS
jgi:hypothetical protein